MNLVAAKKSAEKQEKKNRLISRLNLQIVKREACLYNVQCSLFPTLQIRRQNVLDVQLDPGAGAASVGGTALSPDRLHEPRRSVGERANVFQV